MTDPRTFADEIQQLLRDHPDVRDLLPDGHDDEVDTEPITVRKATMYLPVSCCALTDTTGVNHCTHPERPIPRLPWTKRTHTRLLMAWRSARYRLGCWIAGTELNEEDDD